ncbi:hypothetical protein A9Q94_06500 [Rhodobacterales bacterium 56_14_T64]|nr:hypothetical protein A9Q94_06500 [Rhodobacterales bacterium 56_14_T64]
MADSDHNIATRAERDRWIEDRKNDPSVPTLEHPKPSWAEDAEDPDRLYIRMRERRIRNLTNRLDGAVRDMEREWDQNS